MSEFDVLGIGNALVDVLSNETEAFVSGWRSTGRDDLIEEPCAHELYEAMGPAIEISGGSAATPSSASRPSIRAAYLGYPGQGPLDRHRRNRC
jgi:hypothetical protein